MNAPAHPRHVRLLDARIYLIWSPLPADADTLAALGCALESGCIDLVQLRLKTGSQQEQLALGRTVGDLCRAHGALLIVNDDPALALRLDADGVHLGQDDVAPRAARALLGPARLIGVSAHDASELAAARTHPVDYAGLGPCFETRTKDLRRAPGGAALLARALPARGDLPVFPIGGITPANVPDLVAAGARAVAVGAGILRAADPALAARELRAALTVGPGQPAGSHSYPPRGSPGLPGTLGPTCGTPSLASPVPSCSSCCLGRMRSATKPMNSSPAAATTSSPLVTMNRPWRRTRHSWRVKTSQQPFVWKP